MKITIASLRAAGLSAEQIVRVLETSENEKLESRRTQNRISQQNHRSRQQNPADGADTLPPSSPPSMVSPITPSLTTPSSSPIPLIRAVACATRPDINLDFEIFWKAYPKRDGANPKTPAKKKWVAAVRSGVEISKILEGANAYRLAEGASNHVGTPYIAQTLTWLNQRRWEDYASHRPSNGHSTPIPPTADLPSDAELRKRYATYDATAGGSLLDQSSGVREQVGGVGVGEKRDTGTRSLDGLLSMARVETVYDKAN